MILTGTEIENRVRKGDIHISPFLSENINPNSYNYRLGPCILEAQAEELDVRKKVNFKKIILPPEGYILRPHTLYLASTLEEIGSDMFVVSLIGRSSVGRLGLFLQITADLGHIGTKHCWTLELHVVQPLRVYPGMKIGQVSFWEAKGIRSAKYTGKYGSFSEPHHSEIHTEFEGNL